MNKEQKAAVVDELAEQIEQADAVFAIDYRGLSVTQAVDLRARLGEVDAAFRVVKNRLTSRALDKAGVESLKELLEGPTAFTFARGDAALAAKTLAGFRREHRLLEFKGGTMEGEPLTVDQIEAIARLPGRDALQGQFVGVLASPLTGLVRGLGGLIQGLALQLGQIQERGLVGDDGEEASAEEGAAGSDEPGDEESPGEQKAEDATDEQQDEDASDEQQDEDASDEAKKEEDS